MVAVSHVRFGEARPVVIAGPCAVESVEQTLAVARAVKEAGADMLRGGAFKPRTSPHDFQGLGIEGLRILREVSRETGMPDRHGSDGSPADRYRRRVCGHAADRFAQYAELSAAHRSGKSGKPVLLKRGMAASLCEWLGAAEYISNEGNLDIVLCERGIKAYPAGEYSRNVLDLSVIPAVKPRRSFP